MRTERSSPISRNQENAGNDSLSTENHSIEGEPTMTTAQGRPRPLATLFKAGLLPGIAAAVFVMLGQAADHRDGPIFVNTQANGRADCNDIYCFRSPTDPANAPNFGNTVLAFTVSPFPGIFTPATFEETVGFEIKVDNNGDAVEDITFRFTFSPADMMGNQTFTLRGLPATKFPRNGGILVQGTTNAIVNLPTTGNTPGGGKVF